MIYDIYNPTQATREIYDGIEGSNRLLRIAPGQRLQRIALGESTLKRLLALRDDLEIFPPGSIHRMNLNQVPAQETDSRLPVIVEGMWGIGDNIHQRAVIRELLKTRDVYLEGCQFAPFHDLPISFRPRGKVRRVKESTPQPQAEQGPSNAPRWRMDYHPADVKRLGSILAAQFASCGLAMPDKPDFSMPVPRAWREKAKGLKRDKPLLIYRPITLNKAWLCEARSPDTAIYAAIFKAIRDKFFVVSIADLQPGRDWIVGPEQDADLKFHAGELTFEEMAGLFAEAALVFANPGFAPVLAQAVGTPSVVVYGGNECFATANAPGAHLAPTLAIEPREPCQCHSCNCPKQAQCKRSVDVDKAIAAAVPFAEEAVRLKPKVLIFATTYVDTQERFDLTQKWIDLHGQLNPGCDLLLVDSQSPNGLPRCDVWGFEDNIGHLSRNGPNGPKSKGKDGWGRAFCRGLELAIERGYDFAVHIEGDSLLRLPVEPIIRDMIRENTDAISTPVLGTKNSMPHWIETGLMFFRASFVKDFDFVAKYDFPNRKEVPSPEAVIKNILGAHLKLMPWRAMRGDKNQLSVNDVSDLDWVTHCGPEVYHAFLSEVSPKKSIPAPPLKIESAIIVRVNLGCGDNKLPGWANHDADVDITKPLPWPDGSVDTIFCEHCVEHIPYAKAIDFFRECFRVLKPGGRIRITVPSIEQIYRNSDAAYWKFTTKWQPEASRRGAMTNILFRHGHQAPWTASLMEATLYYAGFDDPAQRQVGQSPHPELQGVEGHHKVIGEAFNTMESMSFEATKFGGVADRVAIIVGGSIEVGADLARAHEMFPDADYFICNDMIGQFDGQATAVSLHPSKLGEWLAKRRGKGLPPLKDVWSHRPFENVTRHTEDWGGSSGLFGIKVARLSGYAKIVLCGVPMRADSEHFLRKTKWTACDQFRRAWQMRREEIAPYVRSFSGWTAELFGTPETL